MPFHRERYPADWKEIRARILVRAGNKCEICKAPNRSWISRDKEFGGYMTDEGRLFKDDGTPAGWARGSEWDGDPAIHVVLTIAHRNHTESDNRDENLAAWCQRCHLAHDRADNARRARETKRRKLAVRDMW